MKQKHAKVNAKFDATFSKELRDEWLRMIRDWEKDQSMQDPFTYTAQGRHYRVAWHLPRGTHICLATNLADVRRRLAEADEEDARRGMTPHEVPGSVFIRMGLEIEEHMYVVPPASFPHPFTPRTAGGSFPLSSRRKPQRPALKRLCSRRNVTPSRFESNAGPNSSSFTCQVLQHPPQHPTTT